MSEEILQYIDRRNFMMSLISAPALDAELKDRKNTNTLPVQLELLKVFYKLSRKLNCEYTVTIPYLHRIEDVWYDTITVPIIGMFDYGLILLSIEEIGKLESKYEWITGNSIKFDNPAIPELINFNGHKTPFFEMFRLGIVKNVADFSKIESEQCEIDICNPLQLVPIPIPFLPK